MKWAYASLDEYCDTEYESAYNTMSASRKARIARLKKEGDHRRSVLAELIAKKLLKEEGIDAVLESEASGRPYLKGSDRFISISHSSEMAACAISDRPIGIDIEKIKEIDLKLVRKVCTEREKEYVERGDDKSLRFLEIWTAKEAYFKKQGTGITNLKAVDVMDLKRECKIINGYIINIVY